MSDTAALQGGLLVESQWQLESMQLVNFGPFDGYHRLDFQCGFPEVPTTVISGESGTGKSTIEDAFFEVMTRNGSYNTASNEGGRGGSLMSEKRSLIGYVRGKLEDVEDDNGNPVVQMLRDGSCNRWSAVVLTYVSDTETVFTVAKLFWIGAGYNANSDIKQLRMTMYRPFDPRILEAIADVNFTAERVKRVLGDGFKSFTRVDEFLTYVYRVLKIDELGRGKDVMDLLGKIRSGASFKSIAELFRAQVLDVPVTFERAEQAAESYHEHMDAYEKMRDKQKRVDALTGLRQREEERAEAVARTQALQGAQSDAVFGAWENATRSGMLREHAADLEARAGELEAQRGRQQAVLDQATAVRDGLSAQLAASGFTEKLAGYDALLNQARERVNSCRSAQEACAQEVEPYFGKMPNTEEAFGELLADVRGFLDGYEDEYARQQEQADSATAQRVQLDVQVKELREELEYYTNNPTRIPPALGKARSQLAAAAGLSTEDLPFAAELMEVADEEWRYAVESVYGGFARTLLVDADDFEQFSASIDKLKLRSRVNFRKVQTGLSCAVESEPGYLSEKIEFAQDSPFAGWLMSTVRDENHDALRVGSAAELAGPGRRVTVNGQTRDGNRGAHGRDKGSEGIIGFDNSAKIEELGARLLAANEEWRVVTERKQEAKDALTALVKKQTSAERIVRYDFAQVDLAGALAAQDQAEEDRQRFLEKNEELGLLEARLRKAEAEVKAHTKTLLRTENELEDVQDGRSRALEQLEELAAQAEQFAHVDAESAAYKALCEYGEERFAGHGLADNLGNFDTIVQNIRMQLARDASASAAREKRLEDAVVKALVEYQENWPDTRLGVAVESVPDYLELLAKLEAEGFHTQKDSWYEHMVSWIKEDLIPLDVAYRDARAEIDDKLEPINNILRTLPFGRDGGRLEIVCADQVPADARDFSALMRELLDYERNRDTFDEKTYHRKAAQLMEVIDPDASGSESTAKRNLVLDRRRHVKLTARVIDPDNPDKPRAIYNTLASKSGGEVAEIVAFILGAALLYRLGQDGNSLPGFAPVLLDEGFIKADSRFTSRAIAAWQGFGFQLIIAVPEEKYQSVVARAQGVLGIVADASRRSYVVPLNYLGDSGGAAVGDGGVSGVDAPSGSADAGAGGDTSTGGGA